MAVRATAVFFGAVFGFAMAWGQFIDPDRIRDMLLLEDAWIYLMMATTVAVGFVGVRLLRRLRVRALVTREPISWSTSPPERRHVVGAAIFGAGWAATDACPAPIAGQLAHGVAWSAITTAGVMIGIYVFLRRQERGARVRSRPVRSGRLVPLDHAVD